MRKYLFYISIILIIYFMATVYNHADWDLWARLAMGALIFKTDHIPMQDIFSYTETKNIWIDHEWGSGLVFYFLADNFGDAGLVILKFLMIFSIFIAVFKLVNIKREDENKYSITYYFLFLYAILFGFITTVRAQGFTFGFFAWWLYWLEKVKKGNNKILWIFPITTVIWANLHGGFLAGLGILFLYGLGELISKKPAKKYFLTLLTCILATLINPYGLEYWNFLLEAATMSRPFITEWQNVNLFGPLITALGFKIFLFTTIFSMPYLLIKNRKNLSLAEIFILLITCFLGINHYKHSVLFVIVSACYTAHYFMPAFYFYTKNLTLSLKNNFFTKVNFFLNFAKDALFYGIIIIIGVLTLTFVPIKVKLDNTKFPAKAVNFIDKNNLNGNLLVLFNWGSYALWKLYPKCKVAVDGRYEEIYTEKLIDDVARFHYILNDWNGLMKNYKTDLILMDVNYPVLEELLTMDDWKVIYRDDAAAVFIPSEKDKDKWLRPDDIDKINSEKYNSNIIN